MFILLPQVTWKINCQNFTFIRNILPNKLGNPESIKNQPWQLKISLTNLLTVCQGLLRAFCKLFYLQRFVSNNQLKNIVWQWFYVLIERYFKMTTAVTLVPIDSASNWFLVIFCLSYKARTKTNVVGSWCSGIKKYLFFFVIASRALNFNGMTNSIYFCKGIFLLVNPVCLLFHDKLNS